jgi:uncharacterized protein with NAD-binding domain and iron-sulfur cluster
VWGQGGEMTQALYAHVNNKIKKFKKRYFITWGKSNVKFITQITFYSNANVLLNYSSHMIKFSMTKLMTHYIKNCDLYAKKSNPDLSYPL